VGRSKSKSKQGKQTQRKRHRVQLLEARFRNQSHPLRGSLLQKLKEAGVTAGLRSNNIRQVDIARTPGSPAEPNIPRNLGFGFVLGLTSGIGLAFLLEGIDNTVRTPEQAQAISGLPSLGMIPLGSRASAETSSKRGLIVAAGKEPVEL
jgi:hypothetical protein